MKNIKYKAEPFLKEYISKSPIEVGDMKSFADTKKSEFEEVYEYFSDEFMEGFASWLKEKYDNFTLDEIRPRCFEVEGIGPFLLGLRYKNGNIDAPFVSITIGFNENKLFDNFGEIFAVSKSEYQKFSPKGLVLMARFTDQIPQPHKIWSQVVAGLYHEDVEVGGLFRLEKADEAINYDSYYNLYESWRKQNSSIAEFVSQESEEDLNNAVVNGLYFNFFVDDKHAGFICAENEELYGNKGVYIFEEFLFEEFRGKGLAKIMQRLFHKNISDDVEYVWGHILKDNIPSLKTALACKRRAIESEVFFPFN